MKNNQTLNDKNENSFSSQSSNSNGHNKELHISLIIDDENTVSIEMNMNDDITEICREICVKYNLNEKVGGKLKLKIQSYVESVKNIPQKETETEKKTRLIKRLHDEAMEMRKKKEKFIEQFKKDEAERELKGLTFTPTISPYTNKKYEKVFANFEDKLYYDDLLVKNKKQFRRLKKNVENMLSCRQFINKSKKNKKITSATTTKNNNSKPQNEKIKSTSEIVNLSKEIHTNTNHNIKKSVSLIESNKNVITLNNQNLYPTIEEIKNRESSNTMPIVHNFANNNNNKGDSSQTLIVLNNYMREPSNNNEKIEKSNYGSASISHIHRGLTKKTTISSQTREENINNMNNGLFAFGKKNEKSVVYYGVNDDVCPTYASIYKHNLNYNNHTNSYLSHNSRREFSSVHQKRGNTPSMGMSTITIGEKEMEDKKGRSQTLDEKNIKSGQQLSIHSHQNSSTITVNNNINNLDNHKLDLNTIDFKSNANDNSEIKNIMTTKTQLADSPMLKLINNQSNPPSLNLRNFNPSSENKHEINIFEQSSKEFSLCPPNTSPERKKDKLIINNPMVNLRYEQFGSEGIHSIKSLQNSPKLNKMKSSITHHTKLENNKVGHKKSKSFSSNFKFSEIGSEKNKNVVSNDFKILQDLPLYDRLYISNEVYKKNKEDQYKTIMKMSCPFTPKISERSRKIVSAIKERNEQKVHERLCYSHKNKTLKQKIKSFSKDKTSTTPISEANSIGRKNASSERNQISLDKLIRTSSLKFTSVDNIHLNINSESLNNKNIYYSSSRSNLRNRMKIREVLQENNLFNSIEKLNNKQNKLKNSIHKQFSNNFGKFKLNNFKEIFEVIYNNCSNIDDFRNLEKFGISKNIKDKLVLPTCYIIKDRNLEFNFQNFYMIANEILNFIL